MNDVAKKMSDTIIPSMKPKRSLKDKRLALRVKDADLKRLEAVCVSLDISTSEALRDALHAYLAINLPADFGKVSAVAALENDPANHAFTAQALADQAEMERHVASAKKTAKVKRP